MASDVDSTRGKELWRLETAGVHAVYQIVQSRMTSEYYLHGLKK